MVIIIVHSQFICCFMKSYKCITSFTRIIQNSRIEVFILYDFNKRDVKMSHFNVDRVLLKINGTLINKGTDVTYEPSKDSKVLISLGPLSYVYRLHQIKFHFGGRDSFGSEHVIDGKHFSAEVTCFNSLLYIRYTSIHYTEILIYLNIKP